MPLPPVPGVPAVAADPDAAPPALGVPGPPAGDAPVGAACAVVRPPGPPAPPLPAPPPPPATTRRGSVPATPVSVAPPPMRMSVAPPPPPGISPEHTRALVLPPPFHAGVACRPAEVAMEPRRPTCTCSTSAGFTARLAVTRPPAPPCADAVVGPESAPDAPDTSTARLVTPAGTVKGCGASGLVGTRAWVCTGRENAVRLPRGLVAVTRTRTFLAESPATGT